MATKISKVNAERLKKLGISAKTEEEAKKILLDRLEKAGIPGMDEETIDNLIDIVGSFAELEGDAEEEAAPADPTPAEAQADELAEEAAEEEAEAAAEEDPEPEAEPEEEPAEEEAAPAPKPKKAAPKRTAPAKKAEKAAEDKPAKESKKKKPSKRNEKGTRLKPQTNPDDLEMLRKALSKYFPEKEFQYVTVSQGISIKFGGANSHPVAIMFENVYAKEGELATTNVVLNTFRSQASQDKLADDGVDFVPTWNNLPWLKGITWSDAMEIVKTYLPAVSTADTRLGKNREKMEADLKATGKKTAPAPKKEAPKAAPAEDPKAKARAALAKAAAAKKAKAAKK